MDIKFDTVNPLRVALEHIQKTAGQSRTQTRRLRWIAKRAELALAGRPYVASEHELPPNGDSEHFKLLRQKSVLKERADLLEGRLMQATPSKVSKCRECGSSSLTWVTHNENRSGVQEGRLRTHEVGCVFVLGCDDCSETLAVVGADSIAAYLPIATPKQAEPTNTSGKAHCPHDGICHASDETCAEARERIASLKPAEGGGDDA